MNRLREIERRRLVEQAEAATDLLQRLETQLSDAPTDSSLQFAIEQCRRNIERLRSAASGHTPSAMAGRDEEHPGDDSEERRAYARHEALHTADNVATFLGRIDDDPGAVERAARWLLRLELELFDLDQPSGAMVELALALLRSSGRAGPPAVAPARAALARLRGELQ